VFLCHLWASRNDIGLFEDHQIGCQPSTNCSVIVSTMSFKVVAFSLPCNNLGEEGRDFVGETKGAQFQGSYAEACSSVPEAQRTFVALHLALPRPQKIVFLCS
jgi:hypothetical protein